jgi:hypothetical protein
VRLVATLENVWPPGTGASARTATFGAGSPRASTTRPTNHRLRSRTSLVAAAGLKNDLAARVAAFDDGQTQNDPGGTTPRSDRGVR